jgi:pimeloyl-ACP methyl ester carboxylesterase
VIFATRFLLFVALGLFSAGPVLSQTETESHTIQVNGIEVYYETSGEGEPLLLLHSGTQTVRMWDPFVEGFAARYRVIAVDLRGHGGSTNPSGEWATRQFARDVLALLDQLGIGRVKGIGASAGAMTLLHMATQQPERVEAMVVIGVGTYLPLECRQTLGETSLDGYPEAVWERLRAKHRHGDEQIRALYAWVASLADTYDDMVFTPDKLATIRARTLVLHGDRDYCFPASMAWEIYAAIPHAYLWVLPNGTHVPIGGANAPRFAETALQFLGGAWEGD